MRPEVPATGPLPDWLLAFIKESNHIEGIHGEPLFSVREAHRRFLRLENVNTEVVSLPTGREP